MCFIVSEQALELLRQFSRWGKEEGENWRQRNRNPSVPSDSSQPPSQQASCVDRGGDLSITYVPLA